jgi:hypothetical protein
MWGTFVGVSLGLTLDPFTAAEGGRSCSFVPQLICRLLPAAPTDGDPAIIGSIWLCSDVPDCRFMELIDDWGLTVTGDRR